MVQSHSSTNSTPTVMVLGGRGFIGSHVAKHLAAKGAKLLIGTRRTAGALAHSRLHPLPLQDHGTEDNWIATLAGVDVVVNAVGILRQRPGESYDAIHHRGPAALASACAKCGVTLIHVSIMGVDSPARSRFVSSKVDGERAVSRSGANWFIVRPSLVDGNGGNGARWFRRVAAWPIHFAPANAVGGFAPVAADDVGEAIARLAVNPPQVIRSEQRIYELSGPRILDVFQYLALLDPYSRVAPRVAVPAWLARLASHVCDLLHVTPFSFGHYELLRYRNYPLRNRLHELLGRPPRPITSANSDLLESGETLEAGVAGKAGGLR